MVQESGSQDLEHLRLLSIFHFVVAGIAALFSLFPVLHLWLGVAMLGGSVAENDPAGGVAGCFFVGVALLWMAGALTLAVCLAVAGHSLRHCQRYTYCLVIAGVTCALVPVGTVLGVFTILVLMRPSVKEMFAAQQALAGET